MTVGKRLGRRPISALVWLAALTAMSMLLSLGAGILHGAKALPQAVDALHSTVAVLKNQAPQGTPVENGMSWEQADNKLYEEDIAFLNSLDSVEFVDLRSVTLGYSPQLSPVILLNETLYGVEDSYYMCNSNYAPALALLRAERLHYTTETLTEYNYLTGESWEELYYSVKLECSFLEMVRGNSQYAPYYAPGDKTFFTFYVHEEIGQALVADESLIGSALLCYGEFLPSDGYFVLPEEKLTGTVLRSLASKVERYEDGQLLGFDGSFWSNSSGEEGRNGYEVPLFAKVEGSPEDFLADPENSLWQEELRRWEIRQQVMSVFGTQKLESMYLFAAGECTMTQGRSFSSEDYEEGAPVCIISDLLAQNSGLEVGDTLQLTHYPQDEFGLSPDTEGNLNGPTLDRWARTEEPEPLLENQELTVVGIYHMDDAKKMGAYGFSVNTVFLPQKAMPAGADGGQMPVMTEKEGLSVEGEQFSYEGLSNELTFGIYFSVVLKNGQMEEFSEALKGTNLEERFLVMDSGYEGAMEGIAPVEQGAKKLFALCAGGWLLLLSLYLLLYQASERRNIAIMRSLGARPGQARRYLFGSGLFLAFLGILLGLFASGLADQKVQGKLLAMSLNASELSQHSGAQIITGEYLASLLEGSTLPVSNLALWGLGQLGIVSLILWLQAALLSRPSPRKIMKL